MNDVSPEILEKINHWAEIYDLPSEIIHAQVLIESGGDTWAARYESHWRWFLDVNYWARKVSISSKTERICQMMSFGLMQTVGCVARELGHKGDLTQLCDPDTSLQLGCKKMSQLKKRHGTIEKTLSAYNSGRPNSRRGKIYVEKVLTMKEELY